MQNNNDQHDGMSLFDSQTERSSIATNNHDELPRREEYASVSRLARIDEHLPIHSLKNEQLPVYRRTKKVRELKDYSNFAYWRDDIRSIMRTNGLQKFFEKELDSPTEKEDRDERWDAADSFIDGILKDTVPTVIYERAGLIKFDCFADVWKAIERQIEAEKESELVKTELEWKRIKMTSVRGTFDEIYR